MNRWLAILTLAAVAWVDTSAADSTDARCDIYPKGSDHTDVMIPCTFSQRQGHITIARSDGVTHQLSPFGDKPGDFRDQRNRTVFRVKGLGDQGVIFRFPNESVYVYWSTAGLQPATEENNPTWPFTTEEYDATTLLRCKASGASEFGACPAGVVRMGEGQGSVVVQNQSGEQFTINFMTDYVNATNREVEAEFEGDTWILHFANGEVWEVPRALIEGG
jgi:hypothetical protein